MACHQIDVPLTAVARTIEQDEGFRALLDRLQELLSQNVAAALYRSAMEGSVSAQQFYLKNRPPPEWPQLTPDDSPAMNDLTDDELLNEVRENAARLSAFLAAPASCPSDENPA
ncbi:MAG: hypothetical protein KDA80_07370 [Planctomycetaceae bacterium]|nr:hypothetical protein [Planctomycetaceae bacterium]